MSMLVVSILFGILASQNVALAVDPPPPPGSTLNLSIDPNAFGNQLTAPSSPETAYVFTTEEIP